MSAVDRSAPALAAWWREIDRASLGAILGLSLAGLVLLAAASPAVAVREGFPAHHFVLRQATFLPAAALVLVIASSLSLAGVRRAGLALFAASLALLIATAFVGDASRGAQRWLALGPVTAQPSEFAKPALAVVTAWLLARGRGVAALPVAALPVAVCAGLVAVQPDTGAALTMAAVFGLQVFVAGLPWPAVFGAGALFVAGGGWAYLAFDHVHERLDRFWSRLTDPQGAELHFQEAWAQRAVEGGGLFGRGPGAGEAKAVLPDAHSDFIVAVAVEEFGAAAVGLLLLVFAFLVLRGLCRAEREGDGFALLAATGLLGYFGLQTIINFGVNLGVLPTKGMTLPLVSYGGSSLVATAITLGFVLALTRHRPTLGPPR